jgi:hypothetical protein
MPDDPLVSFIVGSIVLAIAAWAGWSVGGWRRGRHDDRHQVVPAQVWLCDGCLSFNDPTHETCYRCHHPRPADARVVEPDPEFHLDQQLGRSKTSVSWGASSPWLAADEPLRDAWLAERARAAEGVQAGSAATPGAGEAPEAAAAASGVGAAVEPERDPTRSVDEPL